jgi:rubrerythrin
MAGAFSADEVFQIALELEQTGQVFYEALAVACGHAHVADLCRRLARQEAEHYRTFQRLRGSAASGHAPAALAPEEQEFIQTMINQRVVPDPARARRIAREGGLGKTLDLAIRMEHDSVAFYRSLLKVLDGVDAQAVATIIREEQKHARDLTAARRGL